jgi:membrane-bound lytic murein transglycosylase B
MTAVTTRRRPTRLTSLLCGSLLGLLAAAPSAADSDDHRGWGYLIDKLVGDGVDRERATRVFDDPRMGPFDGLGFSVAPSEPRALYRGFLRPSSIAAARRCRLSHASILDTAEHTYGVPGSVVAAVLYVETGCGRNTGSSLVFYRLARLAMANEPANLEENVARLAGAGDSIGAERVRARAKYLEDTFYPEVRAALDVSERMGVDVLALRGSASGAIGFPQFLPTSYLRYGVDAGGDGRVDLFDSADAAASCANYLAASGWQPGISDAARRAVIRRYNHSDAYVDTVLALARWIERPGMPPASPVVRRTSLKKATKPARKKVAPKRTTHPPRGTIVRAHSQPAD